MRLHAEADVCSNTVELYGPGTLRLTVDRPIKFRGNVQVGPGLVLKDVHPLQNVHRSLPPDSPPLIYFKGTYDVQVSARPVLVATAGWLEWRMRTGLDIDESHLTGGRNEWQGLLDTMAKGHTTVTEVIEEWEDTGTGSWSDIYYMDNDSLQKREVLKSSLQSLLDQKDPEEVMLFLTPLFPPLQDGGEYEVQRLVEGSLTVAKYCKIQGGSSRWLTQNFEVDPKTTHKVKGVRAIPSSYIKRFEAFDFSTVSFGLVQGSRIEADGRTMTFDRVQDWRLEDATIKMKGVMWDDQKSYRVACLRTQQIGEVEIPQHFKSEDRRFF